MLFFSSELTGFSAHVFLQNDRQEVEQFLTVRNQKERISIESMKNEKEKVDVTEYIFSSSLETMWLKNNCLTQS